MTQSHRASERVAESSGPSVAPPEIADIARLEEVVDRKSLSEICRSFFELFSIPIRIFSSDGNLLADVHEERHICRYVNSINAGRGACAAVVGRVKNTVPTETSETGKRLTVLQTCFTGAEYHVVPVEYQGRLVGRAVFGPYLPGQLREVPESLLALDPSLDPEKARVALTEMPRVRAETLGRIVDHLQRIVQMVLFAGHKAHLTSQMHVASVRESFRELTEKNAHLQQAYDQLQELDRLKSNFLATVSHELRTPLTAIIGYSDMLASGVGGSLSGDQVEFVEIIRRKGDQLLSLISAILDANKLEQGSLAIIAEPLDSAEMVRDLEATMAPFAQKKGIATQIILEDALPKIAADSVRLKQVLQNLAENAIKFTPRNGVVTFAARVVESEGADALFSLPERFVEFVIEDTGIGIPLEEHEKIFAAFYQVEGGTTRVHGGTGLGLSIVKQIVELHHGSIRVESEVGKGSRFYVRIPEAP